MDTTNPTPPSEDLPVPAEGAESWDQTQWMDYASSNWDTLSEALCVRAFDLSEQAYSAFTAVEDESIDGRYVRTRYENEGLLQLRTWRDGGLKAEGVYLMDRQQGYISTDEIAAFILNVVSLYPADTEYTPPPEGSLSDSLTVDGTLVLMQTSETNDGDIKHFGWSGDLKDLWLWPLPCPETSTQQYFLQGSAVGLERPSYIEVELLYQPFGTGFLYVDIRCLATGAAIADGPAFSGLVRGIENGSAFQRLLHAIEDGAAFKCSIRGIEDGAPFTRLIRVMVDGAVF
eukprot:gene25864-31647_t